MSGFSNLGSDLTIIYSITSGVLTLVGLIAVFVSLNSQHRIQKGREIIWNLVALPYKNEKYNNISAANEIYSNYVLYEQVVGKSKDFTDKIIKLSIASIIFASAAWVGVGILIFYTGFDVGESIFIDIISGVAVIILILFIFVLAKLNSINEISNLPRTNDLWNANYKSSGVNILLLAAMGCRLVICIDEKEDEVELVLELPVRFGNIYVWPLVFGIDEEGEYHDVDGTGPTGIFIDHKKYFQLVNGDRYFAFSLLKSKASTYVKNQEGKEFKKLFLSLDFFSKVGRVSLGFESVAIHPLFGGKTAGRIDPRIHKISVGDRTGFVISPDSFEEQDNNMEFYSNVWNDAPSTTITAPGYNGFYYDEIEANAVDKVELGKEKLYNILSKRGEDQ